MYAVDPTGSHCKSEVQTASPRWEDPFLFDQQRVVY